MALTVVHKSMSTRQYSTVHSYSFGLVRVRITSMFSLYFYFHTWLEHKESVHSFYRLVHRIRACSAIDWIQFRYEINKKQ